MPKLHSSGRGGKGKCPPTGGARRQSKLARSRLRKVACSQNSGLARVGHLHAESRSKLWNPQIPADRTQRCTKSENCSQYVLPRFSTFWPHGHGMQEVPC